MKSIETLLKERILIIDGATGTALQDRNLTADDFGGEAYEGCNEHLVLTRPDVIQDVHESYLAAGADIIETNTFGATPFVLAEYDLQDKAEAINTEAVRLAKAACEKFSTPEKPRFIAGAMGPTTKSLSVTGGITFDELAEEFYQQAKPLVAAGVDYLLFETALDTLNLKACYIGSLKAFDELNKTVPIAVSGTIETMGTMLAGQGVEALYASVEHMNPLYIGLNCATGPEFMRDHIRTLSTISRFPVAVVPNAGIPNPDGTYPESPEDMVTILSQYVDEGWLNIIGGCCGTTPAHIQAMADSAEAKNPRVSVDAREPRISGIETLLLEDDGRPYIVGERTNVIGSRAFKRLITEEKWDEATEIARKQVKSGAHIIDICLSNPDRDEVADTKMFYEKVTKMIKAPIMVDSQDPEVVETAFKYTQGKCILNSVNLEDGEDAFESLLPLVQRYGAAVVVGCIEGEMAVTAEDKLKVADNSYKLLTEKYGIADEDIYWDPLVFPCGTGDENYFGSGKETIDGVRLIKEKYPRTKSTLGISNVSFGLPPAGREVLNSVFLYYCTKAGLDTAIVNSEKLVRFSTITDEEKALCDDLLWYRTDGGNDPVANFAAYFRDKSVQEKPKVDRSKMTLDEKIQINIVEGTKEFLIENLDEALQQFDPLGVINNPLMKAMDIVGRMFNENELIVAEVLQSAEVMKTAVAYLEQFMEKGDTNVKGTIVLATVKGDVHDIGKNLVEIILGNNGYKVIDLGIKCPPDKLIEAIKTHEPDMIGLSGLLVKSAQQMVITAKDLTAAGITLPILVGGAALTDNFTKSKIQAAYEGQCIYCKDAMTGLDVCNKWMDPEKRSLLLESLQKEAESEPAEKEVRKAKPLKSLTFDHTNIQAKAPTFEPTILEKKLPEIWPFINPQMVYGNHLGLKGNVKRMIADKEPKAMKLHTLIESLKVKINEQDLLTGRAVYQYYKAKSDGNDLVILSPDGQTEWQRFTFPRQPDGYQLCLTDFLKPGEVDEVCFMVVTAGQGISDTAKKLLDEGNYFESHGLSAIALEAAEGMAELVHKQIRADWGVPDDPDLDADGLFRLKYTGKRFSFGYPACPRLEDQRLLWDLLEPDAKIGVELSEDYMMIPEASVSALVFHHPQARYFRVDVPEED